MTDVTGRFVALEGAFNLRDLGGYPTADGRTVRERRVWRADGPERLTLGDHELLRELAIATVVDLRSGTEYVDFSWPTGVGGRVVKIPVLDLRPEVRKRFQVDTYQALGHGYLDQLEASIDKFVAVLDAIAEHCDAPVLFHCSAGKDRTGIVAAVLLHLLGVRDETIAADYALSHDPHVRRMARARSDPRPGDLDYDQLAQILKGAHADTMAAFLAEARSRHGSLDVLVERGGLRPESVARLRENLLV